MSAIATVLGIFNSVIKPSESADWAFDLSNRFGDFERNLDREMSRIQVTFGDLDIQKYLDCLQEKNDELEILVKEFSKGKDRSNT